MGYKIKMLTGAGELLIVTCGQKLVEYDTTKYPYPNIYMGMVIPNFIATLWIMIIDVNKGLEGFLTCDPNLIYFEIMIYSKIGSNKNL